MKLIDADVLIKDINELPTASTPPSEMKLAVLLNIIAAPAVDAAPIRHGRWIKMTGMQPPEYHGHYYCSECQWSMKGLRNSWTREEELTYCPNCGAKMQEDDDEQTD